LRCCAICLVRMKLTFKAPERAATLEPVSREGQPVPDYLCLVMPLRLLD
jgi:hypothetical protein